MMSELNTPQTRIDVEIWRWLKHLGSEWFESVPPSRLVGYLHDLLQPHVSLEDVQQRLSTVCAFREQLRALQEQPQVAQRSAEWHELRRCRLTASDTAQAIGQGHFGNRDKLLQKKAFPDKEPPFSLDVKPLRWGVMFEPIASRSYSQRNQDIEIHEFGLIPHPTVKCYGASPDGISELGIMIEFKCPYARKLKAGYVPPYYELQMQGQMAVCGLEECHYVECDIQQLHSMEEYLAQVKAGHTTDHGIVLEFPQDKERFIYSPPYLTPTQCIEWMKGVLKPKAQNKEQYTVVFWKLRQYHIQCVRFDMQRWEQLVPQIYQFWQDVLALRKTGDEARVLDLGDLRTCASALEGDAMEDSDVSENEADKCAAGTGGEKATTGKKETKRRRVEFIEDEDECT